jgi:hypothetical protein
MKYVIVELLSNIKVTSPHAGLQTPNIGGGGW